MKKFEGVYIAHVCLWIVIVSFVTFGHELKIVRMIPGFYIFTNAIVIYYVS